MTLDLAALYAACIDHALTLGLFDMVNDYEPKSAPKVPGLSAEMWLESIDPVPAQSGLNATTGRIELTVRVRRNMLAEPQNDLAILGAAITLMGEYSADFTLGGLLKNVDLLGSAGTPLRAQGGYLSHDNVNFRTIEVTLPLIVNDLWGQHE